MAPRNELGFGARMGLRWGRGCRGDGWATGEGSISGLAGGASTSPAGSCLQEAICFTAVQ
jgi:hypothetical protein